MSSCKAMESTAESKAFTSFVTMDNDGAGRMAADALADAIKRTYADTEGDVALITSPPGDASLDVRVKASGSKSPQSMEP
jgi:ribose transport system substrate-binding protein